MLKYTKKGYSWIVTDDGKEFTDIRCLHSDIQNIKCKQRISNVNLDIVLYDDKYPILVDNKVIYANKDIDTTILQKLLLELLKSYLPCGLFEYAGNKFSINTSSGSIKGHVELENIIIDEISIKDMTVVGNIFKIIITSKFKVKTNLCGRMVV